jgi:hypothetical protein
MSHLFFYSVEVLAKFMDENEGRHAGMPLQNIMD